jgi:NTP pyrophosphatase (non-canonical NTP hydrolase)
MSKVTYYPLQSIENKVLDWASDRNILQGSDAQSQFQKTLEETMELYHAIEETNRDEVLDAIGDIIVTLIIQAHYWNTNLTECSSLAYDEIKDRKGKLIDGVFVKEK